ncbi:MAG TPA: signal recognition particle-docking protein FtsY [Syntrophorhabdaceae bacterium]|nr:signal recognition particle-docking protein FtsY [Syntrophorhabdaceae bacterium]
MGLFEKVKQGLAKTRDQLITRVEWAVTGKPMGEEAFEEIEEALLLSDAGFETAELIITSLKDQWKRGQIKTADDVKRSMKMEIEKILKPVESPIVVDGTHPFVILALGVNGVGKTTTIAKMASIYQHTAKTILFGACDTFRAAAIEQLEVWAERLNIAVVKHAQGSDPAAVAFDAVKAAKARNIDILILDTAGRLHTKANLMEEMKKIKRVVSKELDGAPHETLLIVDATNGQNTIAQTRTFHEALNVTGMIITKLDGTAKGGFILPIAHTLKIPVRYVGVGEKVDDLIPFSARDFAEAIL